MHMCLEYFSLHMHLRPNMTSRTNVHMCLCSKFCSSSRLEGIFTSVLPTGPQT